MASSRLERIGTIFTRVEGLLTRGAMKPDDRPLWFDIYRAFPPTVEPKSARPKPEIKPIRQIFYPEDVVRAKFHSQGHGYGAVNMLSSTGETQTRKLVKHYEKLKAEGVPENELVQRSVEAVGVERQQQQDVPKLTARNPDSVTANVLKDADLKNIFTEEKK
ncbi:28S ribosomal protein S23, mitochondrial isoform X2 [Hyposmocoma kahamanoa]|uniref:28S ribosomal protein S23, mitochondrial isoform X2 n=1 Tax=Hyposmocoma kahamanoa TaxID=1477025 RepID=UPI000E6D73FC|nr:28S ribosomal protein S23, mitochondrial isoform X2 [Hyposmocoma kahamanoa]